MSNEKLKFESFQDISPDSKVYWKKTLWKFIRHIACAPALYILSGDTFFQLWNQRGESLGVQFNIKLFYM
jgi:hypothetical protein